VTDNARHTLWKVDPVARQKVLLAGTDGVGTSLDGIGTAAQFRTPRFVKPDGAGTLYILEDRSGYMRKVNIATGKVTTLSFSSGSLGGSGTYRYGVCMMDNGDLYVVCSEAGVIKKLTRNY
jgi:hypothetical protein